MLGCFFNRFSLIYHHSKQVTKWTHQDLYHPKTVDRVLMSMYNNHISVRNCSKSHRFPTHVFHPPDTKLIVVPSHAWSVGQSAPTQVNLIRSVSLPQRQKDIGACLLPAIPKNLASSFLIVTPNSMSFLLDFVATKNGTRLAIYIYFSLQLTSHAQLLTEKSHFRKPPEGSFMFSYTEGTFCNMILWYESDWCHSLITHSPNKQSFNWRNFQVGHGIFFIWYLHTTMPQKMTT